MLAIFWIAIAAVLELFRDTSSAGSANMIVDKTELERRLIIVNLVDQCQRRSLNGDRFAEHVASGYQNC